MDKQCNNECGNGWCCHWEFFRDPKSRYTKDSLALLKLKGAKVFHDRQYRDACVVCIPVVCAAMTEEGCALGPERPDMCKQYPTEAYHNWVLSGKCKYFDPEKHWAFEEMEDYKI